MTDAANPGAADPWPAGAESPATTQQVAGPARGPTVPLPGGNRRIPRWMAVVAAVTAVLSVGAFTTVLVWPTAGETGPLEFHPFEPVGTITLDDQQPQQAQVEGDRVYLASWRGDSPVVTAAALDSGEHLWEQSLGDFDALRPIGVGGGAVRVYGSTSLDWDPRPLVVLDTETGRQLWRRDYYGEDTWYATTDLLVLRDREAGQLRGLEHTSGEQRWSTPFPGRTVMVGADENHTGRSSRFGGSYLRRSEQAVLPGEDRAAQLVDLGSGEQIARQHNVGDPDERMVAHEDRLFVADTTADGYQLFAYDLAEFGSASPEVVYTGAAGRTPDYLRPCGNGRLCVLEGADDDEDREQTELIAVDVSEARELWRQPAPGGWGLLAVGDGLVVYADGPRVRGYGGDGTELFDRPGEAARLNAGNVLIFASELSDSEADLSVAGFAFESGELTELGQVSQVIGTGCAWGERRLVCPTGEGAGIWRFAAQ